MTSRALVAYIQVHTHRHVRTHALHAEAEEKKKEEEEIIVSGKDLITRIKCFLLIFT